MAADAGQVFRGLGAGLGNWALPKEMADAEVDLPRALEVEAMEKIVSLPEDPIEIARRFRHLVTTATEQFNEGNLGRAVQMIDLARELVAEKKVEAGYVEPIRKQGHEALDSARLREFMEKPDRHGQLKEIDGVLRAPDSGWRPSSTRWRSRSAATAGVCSWTCS